MRSREGLLLRLTTDTDLVGLGEISPLPVFDGTTLDRALSELSRFAPELIGVSVERLHHELTTSDAWGPRTRAVRCGLDVAVHDIVARQRGISVATLLGGAVARSVLVNATVAAVDCADAVNRARAAVADGFQCVKLKVGLAATLEDEIERVAAVREVIGHAVQLRLDANGAWDVHRAIATIGALRELDLELIEQPVPSQDVEGLAHVRRAVGVPIAADEAVTSIAQAQRILDAGAADVLVVKPMVLGGLRPARQVVQHAREAGRDVIVTTTVDTGVGVAAALHLAATLPRPTRACGLATGPLLVGDLIGDRLAVEGGTMSISPRPGLGVEVDPEQVLRFGSGIHGETGG